MQTRRIRTVLSRRLGLLLCVVAFAPPALSASIGEIQQALRNREFEKALRLLQSELAQRPADVRLWTLRGYALEVSGKPGQGLAAYERALSLKPEYLPALQGAAQIQYASHRPECRKTLQAIIRLDPANQAAHAMLAVLSVEAGDCPSAVESFRKAGDAVQRSKGGLWQFGNCLFTLHRPAEAAEVFRDMLALDGADDSVRYNLALSLVEARRGSDAVIALLPLARRTAPQADVLTLLASAYESAGRTADALATLRRAVELYPGRESVYVELVGLYLNHDAVDTARRILDAAERQVPGSARFAALRGLILAEMNQLDAAQGAFERARTLSPNAGFAGMGLGVSLLASNQPEKSIEILREERRKRPDSAETNFFLARALLARGAEPGQADFNEMVGLLERASALNPALVEAHSALGKAYLLLDREPDAVREFRRALDLDPFDKTALYQLILIYARTGRGSDAMVLKQRLRDLLRSELDSIRPAPPAR